MKIIITEEQHKLIQDIDDGLITYPSVFKPEINILVIFKNNENYEDLTKIFNEYGYGFYVPDQELIIINGEIFLNSNDLTIDDLRFIEAHEISHLLLNHDGPRSEKDEMDADIGAYILLRRHNIPTERLVDEFEFRHNVKFDEKLTKNFDI
jgi:Zn-dependent peptidase ImmA (M78 family)